MPAPVQGSPLLPSLQWGLASLRAEAGGSVPWLWQGYLAPGAVTLLTSQWKTGKATLAAVLLARTKTGGLLAGLPVSAGRAVVLSEEAPFQWVLRSGRLDLEDPVGWLCRPFRGRPRPPQWQALLDRIGTAALERGAPGGDRPAGRLLPRQERERRPRHARRPGPGAAAGGPGPGRDGAAPPFQEGDQLQPGGSGSGALVACANILVEMRW